MECPVCHCPVAQYWFEIDLPIGARRDGWRCPNRACGNYLERYVDTLSRGQAVRVLRWLYRQAR